MKQRETGSVKWFATNKCFGFIERPDGSELFVHQRGVENEQPLQNGQQVEYEIYSGDKGPQARAVRIVED